MILFSGKEKQEMEETTFLNIPDMKELYQEDKRKLAEITIIKMDKFSIQLGNREISNLEIKQDSFKKIGKYIRVNRSYLFERFKTQLSRIFTILQALHVTNLLDDANELILKELVVKRDELNAWGFGKHSDLNYFVLIAAYSVVNQVWVAHSKFLDCEGFKQISEGEIL